MKYRNAMDRLDQIDKFFGSLVSKSYAKWVSNQRGPLNNMITDLSTVGLAEKKKAQPIGSTLFYSCQIFIGGDRSAPTDLDIFFDTKTMMSGKSSVRVRNDDYSWDFTKPDGDVATTTFNKTTMQISIRSPKLGLVANGSCKPT